MSLYTELKRRNVFRVAAAYIVVGWLLTEVSTAVLPTFGAPAWVTRVFIFVFVLGFPVALFFAWAFEVTPDGIRRESEVDRSASMTHATAKKLDVMVIVLLVAAIGLFGADRFLFTSGAGEQGVGEEFHSSTEADAVSGNEIPLPQTAADTEAPPSIAVLAFDNMSPDPDNAYFAEGISEEILNILAGIQGLKVASRTSAFSFKGSNTPIPVIAEQLGVGHVLEGSVRRAGDRVRITAQLIDAIDDTHLWSDSYDRDLTDIFAVQEEIANAIAGAMRGALGLTTIAVDAPTQNLEAYQLFLKGRQGFYARGEALNQAAADLQRAVALDPGFAEAWAHLAAVANVGNSYGDLFSAWDQAQAIEIGRDAAGRALTLNPDNALALGALGGIEADAGNLLNAVRLFQQAVAADPDDSTANMWLADTLMRWGYAEEALPYAEQAFQQDPLVGINNGVLGVIYLTLGQPELAMPRFERAEEQGWQGHDGTRLRQQYVNHDVEALRARLGSSRVGSSRAGGALTAEQIETFERFMAVVEGRETREGFRAYLDRAIEADPEARNFAFLSLVMGDAERGLPWLKQRAASSPNWVYMMRMMWLPESRHLIEHPEMFQLLQSWDVIELYETRGYPPGCVRAKGPDGDHLDCSARFGGAA